MVNIILKQWDKIGWKFENIYMSMYSIEILYLIGMSWYICIFKFFRPPCMIFDFAFERSLSALLQSVLLISLEKKLSNLMQFQTQMICAALITIPSNRQTPSTLSVFIIPDSVINFHLWLVHWVLVLCLATRVSCSSLHFSGLWEAWGLNR